MPEPRLGGILRPKSGAIKFDGVDVTTLEGGALAHYRRDKVGIVFQAFNLVPSLTAIENVMIPLRAAGTSRAASRQRAEELLRRVNLAERMKHRPGDLSGGQQQRVAVARDRAGTPADPGRRADRAPGLHSGGGGAAVDPLARGRRTGGGGRHPRQPNTADGRSRRSSSHPHSRQRTGHPRLSSATPGRCCSSSARWGI